MRHTLATRAAKAGTSIWDMMDHFGWANPRMAQTYVHSTREGVAGIANLMEDHA